VWQKWYSAYNQWHDQNHTVAFSATDFAWATGATSASLVVNWAMDGEAIVLTPEQADQRLQETRRRDLSRQHRRRRAHQRARRLILNVLTPAQLREYAATRAFTVIGADERIYKIRKGGTTHEMDPATGRATHTHCIHLPSSYVEEDTMVAVKMMLETDPAEFRRIANTSVLHTSLTREPNHDEVRLAQEYFAEMREMIADEERIHQELGYQDLRVA